MAGKKDSAALWRDALQRAEESGNFAAGDRDHVILKEEDTGVWSCPSSLHGFGAIARELVEGLGGFIIATDAGLTWIYGGGQPKGRLILRKNVQSIREAQIIGSEMLGADWVPRWSTAAIARGILSTLPAQPQSKLDDEIMPPGIWHHQSCLPGEYDFVTMLDATSYYHQLACRLPSPRCRRQSRGKLTFEKLSALEGAKWDEILARIAGSHSLRNTLIGCMVGSQGVVWAYSRKPHGVHRFTMPKKYGPFRAAGQIIVATGRELVEQASVQQSSVYSNIDCITVPLANANICTWNRYGIKYSTKRAGKADICHAGSWSIGGKGTKPYSAGDRERIPKDVGEIGLTRYAGQWL